MLTDSESDGCTDIADGRPDGGSDDVTDYHPDCVAVFQPVCLAYVQSDDDTHVPSDRAAFV